MTRKYFDKELNELNSKMTHMASCVDDRIQKTLEVLRTGDLELAEEVVRGDAEIDRQEHENEKLCMNLIVTQQPIARDLRLIASSLKILTDMEREADQCADICEILITGTLDPQSLLVSHVVQMLEKAHSMFRRAVDVYLSGDIEAAKQVCRDDDAVDEDFSRLVLEVCTAISSHPENVMDEVDLLFIIKYVERMGDHATNIAEWVIYLYTGEHPSLNGAE